MFDEVFARHEKIALQFSGGKDSLVTLYLLQDYWPRLTVYFCDSGHAFPETLELVEEIKSIVPRFVTIAGRQPGVVAEHGYPSDLVPYNSTLYGHTKAGDTAYPMLERYTCCTVSIMIPLHDRMVADGITLIIRGQRNDDEQKCPLRSGDVENGIEVLFPIEKWSSRDVLRYLNRKMIKTPRFYTAGMPAAPDCMSCTAWLDHGLPAYLKQYYPADYELLQMRLQMQVKAIVPALETIYASIETETFI